MSEGKKKILNCYAGIGGNRKLWGDEYENIDWMLNDSQHDGKPLVVRSASGCELMKCKYYVDGKCTDPNDWVNENGDAVCGLREDAILVE
mgnify:CR=1 FL=1